MFCNECPKYDKCEKVCPELERFLERKPTDRLYSDRHIRRKEVSIDPSVLETTIVDKWLKDRYGKRKSSKRGENWD